MISLLGFSRHWRQRTFLLPCRDATGLIKRSLPEAIRSNTVMVPSRHPATMKCSDWLKARPLISDFDSTSIETISSGGVLFLVYRCKFPLASEMPRQLRYLKGTSCFSGEFEGLMSAQVYPCSFDVTLKVPSSDTVAKMPYSASLGYIPVMRNACTPSSSSSKCCIGLSSLTLMRTMRP